METIPSPRLGFLREAFLANHLASTDNLTRTTNQPEQPKDSPNKQQHNEKSTPRQRQTEPGLVAFYDIRPGNRTGLFLQRRSPHGANNTVNHVSSQVKRKFI